MTLDAPSGTSRSSADQVCSVSESLAHGLVTRLTKEVNEMRDRLDSRIRLRIPTAKRAAAYRAATAYVDRAIPRSLRLGEGSSGDQSGKHKDAKYVVLHWGHLGALFGVRCAPAPGSLTLALTKVSARLGGIESFLVCTVTRHAIMRLFFRLRTTSSDEVAKELSELGKFLVYGGHLLDRMSWDCEILIPSPRGAFVVQRDRGCTHPHAVTTWMSDERMVDNRLRQAAVIRARESGGFVVNLPNAFPILCRGKVAEAAKAGDTIAAALNRVADRCFDESSRLPAEWRFREPDQISESPPAGAR